MVIISSILQSSLQAVLRPGTWLPVVRDLHQHKESWETHMSAKECMEKTLKSLSTLARTERCGMFYDIHKMDTVKMFLRIFVLTRAEWLDVVEIQFFNGAAEVHSFSTGVIPVSVPFSFILNMVLCFVPFDDMGLNKMRVEKLREAIPGVNVQTA